MSDLGAAAADCSPGPGGDRVARSTIGCGRGVPEDLVAAQLQPVRATSQAPVRQQTGERYCRDGDAHAAEGLARDKQGHRARQVCHDRRRCNGQHHRPVPVAVHGHLPHFVVDRHAPSVATPCQCPATICPGELAGHTCRYDKRASTSHTQHQHTLDNHQAADSTA